MALTQRDPQPLRAALYLRMSLDRSGEGAGIDRQRDACRSLAEARGWQVTGEYVDNSVSATKGVRPQWSKLLEDARAGAFDVVVAWAVDRLVRRTSDLERLIETGVRAATVQGDLDLTTVQGELVAGILATVARAEVRQKGERQRAANLQRAQAGDVGWTRRPFGYDREDGRVVVVEREAEALRQVADKVLGGATLASCARDLEVAGVPTSLGGKWSVTTLRRALINPRMAGRAVSNGEDYGPGQWLAILTTEMQTQLEDVLRDPARRVQQGTELKYLLSGLAECGRCGAVMFASPMGTEATRRWHVYRCRACYLSRRSDLVDEVVTAAVLGRLARPDVAELLTPGDNTAALRLEADALRERRDSLADLLADGLITASAAREAAHKVGERLREVERHLLGAEGGSPAVQLLQAADPSAVWCALTLRERRSVVETLTAVRIMPAGRGVRFDPESVRMEWR